jgi:starvation-inducible DNA-binding protein
MPTKVKTPTAAAKQTRSTGAPKQLATATDLEPKAVQQIVNALNPLIADSLALYVKTKNFHWHMSGSHFRDYHLMLDEQADSILDAVDPLAERVRKLGGTTIRSISHISDTQTLKDDNDDFVEPLEMLRRLMEDNKKMCAAQRDAHKVCDDNEDAGTAGLLETTIDETERRIWFLFEAVQGGEHTR